MVAFVALDRAMLLRPGRIVLQMPRECNLFCSQRLGEAWRDSVFYAVLGRNDAVQHSPEGWNMSSRG